MRLARESLGASPTRGCAIHHEAPHTLASQASVTPDGRSGVAQANGHGGGEAALEALEALPQALPQDPYLFTEAAKRRSRRTAVSCDHSCDSQGQGAAKRRSRRSRHYRKTGNAYAYLPYGSVSFHGPALEAHSCELVNARVRWKGERGPGGGGGVGVGGGKEGRREGGKEGRREGGRE